MHKIELNTTIHAPIERCFDLARSIDLHKISFKDSNEEAVGGVTTGLIGPDQKVLWQATHLGVRQTLEIKITNYARPFYFTDEMVSGAFDTMIHDHFFYDLGVDTVMVDYFYFESPYGILGSAVDLIFLKRYLKKLLIQRNEIIREYAESDKWKEVLFSAFKNQSIAEKMAY